MSDIDNPDSVPAEAIPSAEVAAEIAAENAGNEPDDDKSSGNAEAARYRRRARDAESARDALAERIEGMHRSEIERLVSDKLAVPGDVFEIGRISVGELLNDDGDVDSVKVDVAVSTLLSDRPGLAASPDSSSFDYGQGKRGSTSAPSMDWTKFLGTK